jgi:hypothetical protein
MISKGPLLDGDEVTVTFSLPASGRRVAVAGDFNGWSRDATPLLSRGDVASASVTFPVGRRYAFRYVDQDGNWFNDDDADDFEPNSLGGTNSVLDLTALLLDEIDEASEATAGAAPAGAQAGWLWPIEKAVAVATAPVARVARVLRRCP